MAAPPAPKPPPAKAPPVSRPAKPARRTAIALYDFEAQQAGDLSFHVGDVINLVKTEVSDEKKKKKLEVVWLIGNGLFIYFSFVFMNRVLGGKVN
jgi:hypothetical protein